MPKDAKIRVVLCPHQKLADKPTDQTWPSPAGAVVQLTRKTARSASATTKDATTGANGVASVELDEGVKYTVKMAAPWNAWVCDTSELEVNDKTEMPIEVRLVPLDEYRLLPVRLVRHDHAGPDGDDDGDDDAGERHALAGIPGAMIRVEDADRDFDRQFGPSSPAGYIYAWAPTGGVDIHFPEWTSPDPEKKKFKPAYGDVTFKLPGPTHKKVYIPELLYEPAHRGTTPPEMPSDSAEIAIAPRVRMPSSEPRRYEPLTGASVTVFLHPQGRDSVFLEGTLTEDEKEISFEGLASGYFSGTVVPANTFNGWQVKESDKPIGNHFLPTGEKVVVPVQFELDETRIDGQVLGPQGTFEGELNLNISYPGMKPIQVTARKGKFCAMVPTGAPLTIYLAPGAKPMLGKLPLEMVPAKQGVLPPPQVTTISLAYEHSIIGQAVDDDDQPLPGGIVDIFDGPEKVASVVANQDGNFTAGLEQGGSYIVAGQTEGGEPVTGKPVTINSPAQNVGPVVFPRRRGLASGNGASSNATPSGGQQSAQHVPEAFTDLAAYPVLTEEVSTTGVPAPAGGGGGGGGAAYAQVVDQAMRDVLGWRPGGDLAGFQAALTGAFQLREVEGHTEWSWQQRGYAVQADMGALTGAQASIYARAKAALDQIQPLLAGLTTLNPSKFEPQDLETIRSVVGTELQELVNELAREGGPRIQRVDELFGLLLGEGRKSNNMNPDLVQGHLGTVRQRFALTADEIQTVDEERIVTNFRIIAEQVLALHSSWNFDRKLLSGIGPGAALGTILIWLSRGLEAVCESVGDLMFALDSVFVDAAQRQVIELRFNGLTVDVPEVPFKGNPPKTVPEHLDHQAPMFLSDLLDWVLRVSQDEGPRIIQDAGKDGVLAFKPVLDTLRILVRATVKIAHGHHAHNAMPAGMRTPRVDRAIKVLAAQLDEAANLASLVRVEPAPQIASATILDLKGNPVLPGGLSGPHAPGQISIVMTGSNFRGPAKAILAAEQNEDLDVLRANVAINTPSSASAIFNNPGTDLANAGTTWVVSIINNDETQSDPIEVLRVPR